jgi:hypothetical protein
MYPQTMSTCDKCSGCEVNKIVIPPADLTEIYTEINAVIGRLDPVRHNTISDRVCQSQRWIYASSATRWPK